MNIRPAVTGILNPPDKLNCPVIYSHQQASKNIIKARQEVHKTTKKISFSDRYSTPKSVFCALGAVLLVCVFPCAKKLFKK